MNSYYYECEFQHWDSDTKVVIKTERKLTEIEAMYVLNRYYNINMEIYKANDVPIPHLGDLLGITRIFAVDFEKSVVITDGDTPSDHNIIVCPPTYKNTTGLKLKIPAYIPANCIVSKLTEMAEEWAYRNKLVRCTWTDFLDNVTDEFLKEHDMVRLQDRVLPNAMPIHLEPTCHVLTQSVTIALRDKNQELTAAYQVEMPNSITTEEELLAHFRNIAKTMAEARGRKFEETSLQNLFKNMLLGKDLYEQFRTRITPLETEAVITLREDHLLTSK